jgi:SHS family lactate transporter-like MFS transporter
LWAFAQSPTLLAVGAFMMQFLVQGAWGVIPAHLNELSPPDVRGTFPGFAYQLGNFFAAANLTIQAMLADHFGGNYGISMAAISGLIAIAVAGFAGFGPQAKEVEFTGAAAGAD